MVYRISTKLEQKATVATFTETLQPFVYQSVAKDSVSVTTENTTTIFFFFNTECEHCQAETALVAREKAQFAGKKIYFLSIEPIEKIRAFADEYELSKIDNITFGSVSPFTSTDFGISGFPTTLIYSAEGKLLKKFKGEVKIEALVE